MRLRFRSCNSAPHLEQRPPYGCTLVTVVQANGLRARCTFVKFVARAPGAHPRGGLWTAGLMTHSRAGGWRCGRGVLVARV